MGLAYLANYRGWQPASCVPLSADASRLVRSSNASSCGPPLWAVLVAVRGPAPGPANATAYLADPVPSETHARAQLAAWRAAAAPQVACKYRPRGTPLAYPAYCDTCNLWCPMVPAPFASEYRITSQSLEEREDFAMLLITIGSPVCGAFLALFIVAMSMCQRRFDMREGMAAGEDEELTHASAL